MRIIHKDLKHNTITVIPENLDDLWTLSKHITKGSIIIGKTVRAINIEHGEEKTKIRKTIFVKLLAETIEFNENQLRVKGKILESSEGEHGYHSYEIEINEKTEIEKEWKNYEIEQIEKMKIRHPKILICVLDDSEACFAAVSGRIEMLATIKGVTGKMYENESKDRYFDEIIKYLSDKDCEKIIIAGPGFSKEDLCNKIKEKKPELIKKIITDSTSTTENGIQEVLRRGVIERITKNSEISEQTILIEGFFARIAKEDKIAYGIEETSHSIENGAVDTLLISDSLVREKEELISIAEKFGAKVKIIDTTHEAGQRFLMFGGIGAILRYKTY